MHHPLAGNSRHHLRVEHLGCAVPLNVVQLGGWFQTAACTWRRVGGWEAAWLAGAPGPNGKAREGLAGSGRSPAVPQGPPGAAGVHEQSEGRLYAAPLQTVGRSSGAGCQQCCRRRRRAAQQRRRPSSSAHLPTASPLRLQELLATRALLPYYIPQAHRPIACSRSCSLLLCEAPNSAPLGPCTAFCAACLLSQHRATPAAPLHAPSHCLPLPPPPASRPQPFRPAWRPSQSNPTRQPLTTHNGARWEHLQRSYAWSGRCQQARRDASGLNGSFECPVPALGAVCTL